MAGLSQPLQKRQGLCQSAFPLSTRHNINYVNFTQCSAPFVPFATSTGLPLPPVVGLLCSGSSLPEKKAGFHTCAQSLQFYINHPPPALQLKEKNNSIRLNFKDKYHKSSI